jgi:hypothetical protein
MAFMQGTAKHGVLKAAAFGNLKDRKNHSCLSTAARTATNIIIVVPKRMESHSIAVGVQPWRFPMVS